MKPFVTQLWNGGWHSGFGSGSGCNPRDEADCVFKQNVSGTMLACYMIRRFGWPNEGSDDYKEICSWTLTTPMHGLYLSVSPYLGDSMNLSFAVRFNRRVQKALYADPIRDAFFARKHKSVEAWWRKYGCNLYVWGRGLKAGDEDELVHKFCDEQGGQVWGIWKRESENARKLPRTLPNPRHFIMLHEWLADFIKDKHPEAKLPKPPKWRKSKAGKWQRTKFQVQVGTALRVAMRDLLRPTNVRDIYFNPLGDIERCEAAKPFAKLKDTGFFEGAGYAPSYWYNPKNQAAIRKAKR